jgi:hypothetical protein
MVDPEDAGPQPECDDPWVSGQPGLPDSYGAVLSNVGLDDPTKMVLPQICGQPGQTLVCTGSGPTWATATYVKDPVDVSIAVKDQVCTIVARDLVVQSPEEEGAGCVSLTDEMEKLNLRIDQIDEKHEMVLDRLDELLGLLKDLKKG